MRYRPFGKAGMTVSAIALTVDDRAGQRGAEALAGLVFAALEAGVNTFHLESCEPEVLATVGRSLAAVERRLLFVSLRLGLRAGRTGLTRDVSPGALTGAIDEALDRTGLGHLDLVVLDEPGEDELATTALTALKQQRASGRVGLLGVAGAHDAIDAHLSARAVDVLASPHHPRSGWRELNRLKAAARMGMGVIAYDYFPEAFRQASTTPGAPQKRGLLAAIAGAPEPHPLAGAGTFAFLHETQNWTAEELCLAYALMEPTVSTVLVRAHEIERLTQLASVPDRDLPAGMAAKVEMARFGVDEAAGEQAAGTSSPGGVVDALKGVVSHLEGFNIGDRCAALRSRVSGALDEFAGAETPAAKGASKSFLQYLGGGHVVERPSRRARAPSPTYRALLLPGPNASGIAGNGERSDLPQFDATPHPPPSAAQPIDARPQTAIWRSKDYDYPVQPTGESFPGPDGRTYLKVAFDGSQTFVPADELIFPQDMTPPRPAPVDSEALQARAATIAP